MNRLGELGRGALLLLYAVIAPACADSLMDLVMYPDERVPAPAGVELCDVGEPGTFGARICPGDPAHVECERHEGPVAGCWVQHSPVGTLEWSECVAVCPTVTP